MTDKPKPWFRLKLKDETSDTHDAVIWSKIILDTMPDLVDEGYTDMVVYGASPMIMAFPDVKKIDLKEFYNE